jgi:hypothetical protein
MAHGFPEGFDSLSIVCKFLCRGCSRMTFQGSCFRTSWDGKPIGPDISGRYVLEQIYGMTTRRGKWGDLDIICAMIAIYRILFFIFIKLNEKLAPGLRVMAREYFSR